MPLPPGITEVTMTDTFVDGTGRPMQGYVVFRMLTDLQGAGGTAPPVEARVPLAPNGSINTKLYGTTNLATYPDGIVYRVDERFVGGHYVRYQIGVKELSTYELSEMPRLIAPTGLTRYALKSELEELDSRLKASHVQYELALVWTFNHGLGYRPNIYITDSTGDVVVANIRHITDNQTTITFATPQSGRADAS